MAKKWSEKVTPRSFIKGHSFPIGLYINQGLLLGSNGGKINAPPIN